MIQRFKNFFATACAKKRNSFFFNKRTIVVAGVFLCLHISAQTLPPGFVAVQVTSGLTSPTAMAFAPDGRIFVTQQNGIVRVIKDGVLLATPFLQISVQASGERGLIGITLDPNFTTNGYVYLYYTLPDGSRNQLSRFTANGDVAIAGSEQIILTFDPLSSATNHNGGAMHFGPDGKLYVAIGENAHSANAQNLDTYHGKLLRVNKDGSVPPGNPFTGSAPKSRVWAYGLRNPFTFTFQPGTGRLFADDVGQNTWEEINDATTGGKNFGWPLAEGKGNNSSFTNPVYYYPHDTIDGTGCAITGGVFFNPDSTNYPAAYWGDYFFLDYCSQWINFLDLSGPSATRSPFGTELGTGLLYISVGKDGNLYYLRRYAGALYKIIYTNNASPAIVKQPGAATISAGQSVTFSVTATGSKPLHYQWQKNGTAIANATASSYSLPNAKTSDAGNYRVVVSNAFGNTVSNNAQLTITPANQSPQATILTPTEGTLYRGGDTIRFSGSATDAEDSTLPASAFAWSVAFHHNTHTHDGPPVAQGVKSGYFVIPQSGETSDNVWYRLILIVSDSKEAQDTVYRDVLPRKSVITLNTQPAGLQSTLDGQPVATPISVSSVEGIERTIGGVTPQASGVKIYDFDRWLHGRPVTQTIITPEDDVTYTAVYKESPFSATKLEAESAQLSGAAVSSMHIGYTGSGFVDYINTSGDYIEWNVNVATAGNYEISFRYALEKGSRSLQIQVNGISVNSSLSFPATGSWTTWADVSLSVMLNAGVNKIRATAIGSSGPNVDYVIVTPQTLQAENASLSGVKTATNHSGYTGSGFADYMNNDGDYIEWLVYKQTEGSIVLNFRYANGSTANRPMQIQVNNVVISPNFSFSATGGWNQWSNATVAAHFNQGINRVKLTATGNSGPNIDYLNWVSSSSSVAPQASIVANKFTHDVSERKPELYIFASPNPASEMVRLQINKLPEVPVTISVVNALGKIYKRLLVKDQSDILQLPTKDLPAGLYLIVAEQGSRRTSTKLLVAHNNGF